MISLKQWMEISEYKITEGSEYGWSCYGRNTYTLTSWNGDSSNGWSMNIVFDTKDQTVYEVEVCDYANDTAYRMINPLFQAAYKAEAFERNNAADEAWDSVYFTDLEVDEDFIEKATAIVNNAEYDKGILVPVELSDSEFTFLAKIAHEQNITFNQLVNNILATELEKIKKEKQ